MGGASKVFDYPVFALSYADGYIVASGGGGGQNYGISDKLEIYTLRSKLKSNDFRLEASTSEQNGIIDSLDFHQKTKIWLGSIDDSTVIFSYRPAEGLRVFGRFKTDFLKKDPKQNVCKFGHESSYFVTGGNECCVRVWRLSDKLVKKVNQFQQVKHLRGKSEGKQSQDKLGMRIRRVTSLNESGDFASSVDGDSAPEDILRDQKKLLAKDALRADSSSVDMSTNSVSNIDDTSPTPSPHSSPSLSPSDRNSFGAAFEDFSDSGPESGSDSEGKRRKKPRKRVKKEVLSTMILEHRDHLKPINDCCIFNDLLVSISNESMIFYKLFPSSRLLLKHKDDAWLFKFVKVLANHPAAPQPTSGKAYTLMTMQYFNPALAAKGDDPKAQGQKKPPKNWTTVTLWSFNMGSRKLTTVKTVGISKLKASALTLDPTEKFFAVGFGDGSVTVYSFDKFKAVKRLHRHKLPVTDLTFVSKDKLLSAGIDFYVFVNDTKSHFFRYLLLLFLLLLVPLIALSKLS